MCKSEMMNGKIKLWTDIESVEPQALAQLENMARLPWVFKHIAVCPDVHYGKGATVGSVIAMKNAVSPAAVGVDIGCGMAAVKTSLTADDLPDSLAGLRSRMERDVPVGFNSHDGVSDSSLLVNASLMHFFGDLHPSVQSLKQKPRSMSQT